MFSSHTCKNSQNKWENQVSWKPNKESNHKMKTLVINTSYKTQELCTIQGNKDKIEKFSWELETQNIKMRKRKEGLNVKDATTEMKNSMNELIV